jgi:chemotaxis protein methyltransferase WspC
MSLSQIVALLRQNLGLDVASVGVSLIERAVKRRVNTLGLRDVSQLVDLLQGSKLELQNLYEAVVIPETFFFRYPESFAALRQMVIEQNYSGTQKLRALSVPCSSGEEPYSLAMTLLDAGLSSEKFQVDAIDISTRLLDFAKLGLFGSNSFRGSELQFRDQYFQKTDAGFQLSNRVRQCVTFEQGNVLEKLFRFGVEPYDLIFCRNLLIYFYPQAQGETLEGLRQILTADGLLFVGSAEASLLTQHSFSSVKKMPMAFAFRKSASVAFHPLPNKQPKVWSPASPRQTKAYRKPDLANHKKALAETMNREKERVPDLVFAEQLADKGHLGEAAEICEVSLREQGPSARAFHLLGLIRDGAGDQHQASEFYRKALYLEPDHYDVLIHLALLKDKCGDSVGAKTLKNRARRVLERTK